MTTTTNNVDLAVLKGEIDNLGSQIKEAKASGADKVSVIDPLVKQLLTKKQLYADNNDGIGVDGKPCGDAAKKKSKNNDNANANTNQVSAENAAKKAAKKAEKAAKKAAHKAAAATGGGVGSEINGCGVGGGAAAAAAAAAAVKSPNIVPPATTNKPAASKAAAATDATSFPSINYSLDPLQLVMNPNAGRTMLDRPFMALAVASLTYTDVDLDITFDPRMRHAMLGLEETDDDGKAKNKIVGDLAMARYLCNRATALNPKHVLASSAAAEQAMQDTWIEYAQSLSQLPEEQRHLGIAMTLEHALQTRSYLVGHKLTMADLALFAALGWPCDLLYKTTTFKTLKSYPCASRWVTMISAHPALQRATQLVDGGNGLDLTFYPNDTLPPLVSGMKALDGAIPGQVVTRFPPEPSGYLHVGHAKAVLLNDYYARRYKGRLIVRFDDTNPTKEKQEYQQSIVDDLELLGVRPDVVTYTSDYFAAIKGYALQLIEEGLAFMDDTPQEQMKEERGNRIDSKYRNTQTPSEAKQLFLDMCDGNPDTSQWCLRAKIDMQSDNGTLRDPVLYRQNLTPHHRTGITFFSYPTYDLACPVVDSLEGVTHALRTTEYKDRDVQYQWILKALRLRRPKIDPFSRVNFEYTVLSKRKLTWFVNEGLVTGWDDARFPTVRGVVRRGVQVPALKTYIYIQGASKRVVNMVWHSFWAENKKELDKSAKRYMAVDAIDHVSLTVTNAPSVESNTYVETPFHPKDPSMGQRALRVAPTVLLEAVDTEGIQVAENIVLLRWGVVHIKAVETGDDGKIKSLEGEYVPDGDYKACKLKLSWIVDVPDNTPVILTEFDHLVTKKKLEEEDKFEDYVNKNTIATTNAIGDAGLKTLIQHDIIQLERRGYYRVDRPYINQDKPIVLYMIPDGKAKVMSGLSGKLAHH